MIFEYERRYALSFQASRAFSGCDICRALVSSGELPQIWPVRLQASHARYLPGVCRRRLPQTPPRATLGHDAFPRFCQSLGASRDRSAYSIQALKPGRRSSGLLLLKRYVKKEGDDQPDLRRVSKRPGSLEPSTLFEVQDCGMFPPCDRTLPASPPRFDPSSVLD